MEQGKLVFVNKKVAEDAYVGVFGTVQSVGGETMQIKFLNGIREVAESDVEEVTKELVIDYLLNDIIEQYNTQEPATLLAWFPEKRESVPNVEEFVAVYKKHYESLEMSKLVEMHKAFIADKYYI